MKRKFHGKRALLNLPGHQGTAAIVAEIEDTLDWEPGKDCYGEPIDNIWRIKPLINLSLSDCTRNISLDINVSDEDEYANSLHKLDTMIDSLQRFRTGMKLERVRYIERAKNVPDKPMIEDQEMDIHARDLGIL